jgi:hypothetical protein
MTEDDFTLRSEPDAERSQIAAPREPDCVPVSRQAELQRRDDVPLGDLVIFGSLLVGAAAHNFLILPLIRAVESGPPFTEILFLFATAAGVFSAQLGVASLWLVWGKGTFLWRLLIHWAAGFVLVLAWALGNAAAFPIAPRNDIEEFGSIICALPIISLAAQIALWPLRVYFGWRVVCPTPTRESTVNRVYFGWRVVRQSHTSESAPPQPLGIRDLLAGIVVTSLSLAALRLMPTDFQREPNYWLGWTIAFVVIAVISALSLLPAVSILLRTRKTGTAVFGWFGYVFFMWIVMLVVTSAFARSGPPDEFVGWTFIGFGSFAAAVALPLLIARSRGYRLTFPRDRIGLPVMLGPTNKRALDDDKTTEAAVNTFAENR